MRERVTAGTASRIEPAESGLEDVFIHLMSLSFDNFGTAMKGFSFKRWWGIVLKEFLQLRRDRITFAMIVGIPIAQLLLFPAVAESPRSEPGCPLTLHPGYSSVAYSVAAPGQKKTG